MAYVKQTWADGAAGGTPLSAARLNVMETGIELGARLATTSQDGNVLIADQTAMDLGTDSSRVPTVDVVAAYVAANGGGGGPGGGGAVESVNGQIGRVLLYVDDLTDVDATTAADGDVLLYDITSDLWVSGALPATANYDDRYAPLGYTAPYTLKGVVLHTGDTVPSDLPTDALIIDMDVLETGGIVPDDIGLKSWTYDPIIGAQTQPLTAATLQFGLVPVRGDWTITRLAVIVSTAGVGTTAHMAAYSSTGTLLATATSIVDDAGTSTDFNSVGPKFGVVSFSRTFGQHVRVAVWYTGGTGAPALSRSSTTDASQGNLSWPGSLMVRSGTGPSGAVTGGTAPGTFGTVTPSASIWAGVV